MSRLVKLNGVDRLVGFFNPVAGRNRALARAQMAALTGTGYRGARRTGSTTRLWSTLGASADADTLPDLDALRARSRDLVRNDPLAHSAISTKVVNVIGTGHVMRPEIDHRRLGLTEEAAQNWEEQALDVWNDWASSPDCDVTRTQTFAELEDLVYRSKLLSGDVLALFRFKERPGRLLSTCLQIVEGDRLSNPKWATDREDLAGGVEMDSDGAAVRYHIANRHAIDRHMGLATTWQAVPAYRGGRRLVLHIRGIRWRPDMTRYAPMLAPVLEQLKARSSYSEAELTAAVISACFALGMRSEAGDLSTGLSTQAVAGNATANTGNSIEVTEPGQVFDLMPGEEIQGFEPGRPNAQFAPFIDAVAQEIGAGTDLPHELLVKQFQASYSASRAAMEMAWQFFRTERAMHVNQFCRPVYAEVIAEAVARGIVTAPGFFTNPLRRAAWLGANWMGPARPTLDPVKDATADEKYLGMGATSLTRITAERFGQDHRAVRRRRRQDGSESVAAGGQQPAQQGPANDDTTDLETNDAD